MADPTSRAEPVFVLGLGAQKCGTTWLHHYIEQSGVADFGLLKEYHVWDALAVPACDEFRVSAARLAKRAIAGTMWRGDRLRWRLQRSPNAYFAHFAGLVGANGAMITGDITPSYCALPARTLVAIRDGLAARGLKVRPIFLMRDPVDRCWSQLRMLAKKGREGLHGIGDAALAAQLPEFCRSEEALVRTDYPATLERLAEVFPAAESHVGFYETMFSEGEINRLSACLGIPSRPELGAEMIHGGKAADLPGDAASLAWAALEPIYRRCNALYPETKSIWRRG